MTIEEPLITVSNKRFNELIEKEKIADSKNFTLLMPMERGKVYFNFCILDKKEGVVIGTPGELLDSFNNSLNQVKEFVIKYYDRQAIISKKYFEYEKDNVIYSVFISKLNNNKLYKFLHYLKLL
jgi:hypothetical protein